MKRMFISLALGLASFAAFAVDGNVLKRWCTVAEAQIGSGETTLSGEGNLCAIVAQDAIDIGTVEGMVSPGAPDAVCPPSGLSNSDGVHIVLDYLRAHPDRLIAPAGPIAIIAFRDKFPCKH